MKVLLRYTQLTVLVLLLSVNMTKAQEYDILLKGGNLIDAKNEINGVYDIAILDGKIAAVGSNITKEKAKIVVNAKGLIVTPGLIDIHGHNFFGTESNAYLSNSFSSLPPDGFTFRSGVTTIVDAGGAGWKNFLCF